MQHFHSRYGFFLFLFFLAITLDCLSKSDHVALADVLRGCGCPGFWIQTYKNDTQSDTHLSVSKSAEQFWGEESSLSVHRMLARDSVPGSNKKLLSKFDQATPFKFPGISKGGNDVRQWSSWLNKKLQASRQAEKSFKDQFGWIAYHARTKPNSYL